jgi:DsbC/DsbD-like thiol-disulfide interchange protein
MKPKRPYVHGATMEIGFVMRLVHTLVVLAGIGIAGTAAAQVPAASVAEARLLEGWRQPDGSHLAAIAIDLAPGWHTYWRAPGEAGIPPQFDWSASRNLRSVAYEWPRPERFRLYGVQALGYSGELVLPVRLVPEDPAAPIEADLSLFYGICRDICMPAEASLAAELSAHGPGRDRARIETALTERARSVDEAGVTAVACGLAPGRDGIELTAEVTFRTPPGRDQLAVIETSDPTLWIAPPESRTVGRTVTARARIEGAGRGALMARDQIRLTVLDDRRAVDIPGCVMR